MSENDMHVDDIAAKFKVSRSTIDRVLKYSSDEGKE